jgi:hypothetical protein
MSLDRWYSKDVAGGVRCCPEMLGTPFVTPSALATHTHWRRRRDRTSSWANAARTGSAVRFCFDSHDEAACGPIPQP